MFFYFSVIFWWLQLNVYCWMVLLEVHRKQQEASRRPRRLKKLPGGTRRTSAGQSKPSGGLQKAGGPRRAQEAFEGPRRTQDAEHGGLPFMFSWYQWGQNDYRQDF